MKFNTASQAEVTKNALLTMLNETLSMIFKHRAFCKLREFKLFYLLNVYQNGNGLSFVK